MSMSQLLNETGTLSGSATAVPDGQGLAEALHSGAYKFIFKSLFERYGMCMVVLDRRLRIQEANSDLLDRFGATAEELHGRALADFFHPSVKQHIVRQLGRLTDNRRTKFTEQLVILPPGNQPFAGEITGIAVHDNAGQLSNVIAFIRPERVKADAQRVIAQSKKLLTELDARILEGVAIGNATVRLAASLYLSRQGVEYHVSTMLRRFKVPNRAALVSKSYSIGILTVGVWPPRVPAEYIK